jgi:serine/threonine protein kinase
MCSGTAHYFGFSYLVSPVTLNINHINININARYRVQVLNAGAYNAKVDIFALGVLIFQVFSRQNISARFECEEQVLAFARDVAMGRRLPMPARFPKALSDIIEKLWNSDPAARPTAQEALKLLTELENDEEFENADRRKSGCFCF